MYFFHPIKIKIYCETNILFKAFCFSKMYHEIVSFSEEKLSCFSSRVPIQFCKIHSYSLEGFGVFSPVRILHQYQETDQTPRMWNLNTEVLLSCG